MMGVGVLVWFYVIYVAAGGTESLRKLSKVIKKDQKRKVSLISWKGMASAMGFKTMWNDEETSNEKNI